MMLKLNKRLLLILAVLCVLMIPCSFASEIANDTLTIDDSIIETAEDTTIYVSNDEIDGDGSQINPYNSISEAVEKYNSTTNSNIHIKNGNYDISKEINIDKDITIIGESSKETILNGNFQGSIFKLSNDAKVSLINLTFRNANSTNGALYLCNYNVFDLKINNCIFDNNINGGAIYYYENFKGSKITIENSVFKNNNQAKNGGAVTIYGGNCLNITNTVFENNSLPTGDSDVNSGGAIYIGGNLKETYITNCNFINNIAVRGSAIGSYCAGDLYITNTSFTNNTSPGNSKYKVNSSVIWINQVNPSEINIYLDGNKFTNNNLNDDIVTEGNVKVNYLDKNTKITGNDVDKYFGDDFNYIVTLTDSSNNPLVGKELIATLTSQFDKTITVIRSTTDNNGQAVFSLKNQKAGKYTVITTFEGDSEFDSISTNNVISIRTENIYNIIFEQDYVHISEGDSFTVVGYIYDEYLVPANLVAAAFTVDWFDYSGKHLIVQGGSYTVKDGNKIEFDVNRCHLVTRDSPYKLYFNVTDIGSAVMTVDLSKDLTNVDKSLDTFYVSTNGNDTTGDGSKNKPLASIQTALAVNAMLGGGKTIIVDEGTYNISTFTIMGDVTIVGKKGKTIFNQSSGRLGMFEIDNKNNVEFLNITFINGYATPIPESLLHITEESTAYIDGCEFYNNTAYYGGAIAVSKGGNVYIYNSNFHDNKGILNTNGAGAIYVERGYAYIENTIFNNNSASDGGAIYFGFESEANIVNSTFVNNSAFVTTHSEGGGGAIFTRSNNLNIYNCSFIENYADLYGGAIYLDYGALNITKSYFENNAVKYSGESKGSAIESAYSQYCNLTLNYSVLICEENYAGNYLVFIHEIDEENHTYNVKYNYWKTTASKASYGVTDEAILKISTENEIIYTGDVVEFTIEFINSNKENGTSPLESSVHDYELLLVPSIGSIENNLINIKNNKATFIYNATTVGTETIKMGNILLDKTYKFTVQDGKDKVDLNPTIKIVAGKTSEITIDLDTDIDSNITIRVNDVDYSVPVTNSKAVLNIETMPGNYEIKAIYQGNDNYKGFIISKSFNVGRYASSIYVKNITTYYNGELNVTLLSDNGNNIANEEITITINNTKYTVKTNENGVATLNLNLPKVGVYNVLTEFNGNSYYNSSQAISTITVEFANLKIKAAEENTAITPIKGSFSVIVTDNDGNPIRNIEISVSINGKEYNVITNNDGIATLDLANNQLKANSYEVTTNIEATNVFGAADEKFILNVIKENATLNAKDITVYANSGELKVGLLDNEGNPITNTNISIEINKKITIITTDDDGNATLALDLTSGKYSATIKLAENEIYSAKDVKIIVNVKESITKIEASNVTVYYSNGKFSAKLTDINGNPIENARLIMNINGNNILAITDETGVATANINSLSVGTYNVTIKFEGNNVLQASNTTSEIKVLSSIISSDIKRGYNSPYDFEARLLNSEGNPLKNTTVSFIVNGKEYNSTTDFNGTVRLSEKLAVGTYAITFINPETKEKSSNYAQIVTRFSGNKNLVMDYYDGSSYKVRVIGDNGKYVGAGEIVLMKINKKTYKVKTDKNGYASLKINLIPKKYTITATYKGKTIKNTVTVKQTLKVTKTTTVKKSAKKLILKATLKTSKNKAIKNKKITFKFKGKKYTAKTNKKGIAKVTIKKNIIKKLKKGKKYTVSVTYVKNTVKCYVKVK